MSKNVKKKKNLIDATKKCDAIKNNDKRTHLLYYSYVHALNLPYFTNRRISRNFECRCIMLITVTPTTPLLGSLEGTSTNVGLVQTSD